jgi:hypothetical protein
MSERGRVRGMLCGANNDLQSAIDHIDEALDYIESYPFLEDDNPFLVRMLKVQKTELETAAASIQRQSEHMR